MSRRGEITVECDSDDCYAEAIYRPENLDEPISDVLEADGWTRYHDQDICPQCIKEHGDPNRPERERDEDDGQTYGHPGDHLKGID